MNTTRKFLFGMLILVSAGSAVAQDAPYDEDRRNTKVPPAGFWPTERMIDLAMNRISEGLQQVYTLDDEQMMITRDLLKSRFPLWMEENRAEIQDLMNQYFEAIIDDQAPSPEDVAAWAARALPLVHEFTEQVEQTAEDMRSFMTDEQQLVLEGQMAMFRVGMNHVTGRMQGWEQGGYDPETEWPRGKGFKPPDPERRKIEDEQEAARRKAMGLPPLETSGSADTGANTAAGSPAGAGAGAGGTAGKTDNKTTTTPAPARPEKKDEWAEYTETFIRRYQLDEAQQNQARRILRERQTERDRYLARRLSDIERVERDLAGAKDDADRARLRSELERINLPVERGFTSLKDRLDRLPTRKQRAEAARLEIENRAKPGAKPATRE